MRGTNPIDELFRSGLKEHGTAFHPEYEQRMNQLLDSQVKPFSLFNVVTSMLIAGAIAVSLISLYSEQNFTPDSAPTNSQITQHNSKGETVDVSEEFKKQTRKMSTSSSPSSLPSIHHKPTQKSKEIGDFKNDASKTAITATGTPNSLLAKRNQTSDQTTIQPKRNLPTYLTSIPNRTLTSLFPQEFKKNDHDLIDRLPRPAAGIWRIILSTGLGRFDPSLQGSLYQDQGNFFHFNAGISYQRKRWKLQSGVGLMKFAQPVEWTGQEIVESYDTTLYLVRRNHTSDGRGKPVALIARQVDTTSSFSEFTCESCVNQLVYLTIPIELNYEFRRSRFRIEVGAGIFGSILINGNGHVPMVLDDGSRISEFSRSDLQPLLFSTAGSVGLLYDFNRNHQVAVTLQRQGSINSWNAWNKQSLTSNQLAIGWRYRLR